MTNGIDIDNDGYESGTAEVNADGRIEKSEAVQAAVMDYFSGIITRWDSINVMMATLAGALQLFVPD